MFHPACWNKTGSWYLDPIGCLLSLSFPMLGLSMESSGVQCTRPTIPFLMNILTTTSQDLEYKDDPLVMSFPEVNFTNLTFVGMASYAYVNWTVDNSEYHPSILISVPQFCLPGFSTVWMKTRRFCFPMSAQFAQKKPSMANSATGSWRQKLT